MFKIESDKHRKQVLKTIKFLESKKERTKIEDSFLSKFKESIEYDDRVTAGAKKLFNELFGDMEQAQ